jgi:hypothetical protein
MTHFDRAIRPHVDSEIEAATRAAASGDEHAAFRHLERAHVLGQSSTRQHVRVHALMLVWAVRNRRMREMLGQILRIAGAATKTVFGFVPTGNTGGANVSAIRPSPVPPDLAGIIDSARSSRRR